MANPYFQFKKFTVWHDKCAMKVGTDGVLLGAWSNTDDCLNILDIGTGSGLIALMLAQRTAAQIDAIDIDKDACLQAKENVAASPFAKQINIHHTPFEEYVNLTDKKYDLIVSNPPYFADSLKCPDQKRTTARHADSLQLSDLIAGCCTILAPRGRIALILPTDRKELLMEAIANNKLFVTHTTNVIPTPGAASKRLLIELSASSSPSIEDELIIEESRHQYTPAFKALTGDYYLK